MAVPQEPFIDIQNATQYGTITPGTNFSWYNAGLSGNCTVTILGGWCEQSSYGPILPGNSALAMVSSSASPGDYNWSSGCCQNVQPVRVSGGHPVPPGKRK